MFFLDFSSGTSQKKIRQRARAKEKGRRINLSFDGCEVLLSFWLKEPGIMLRNGLWILRWKGRPFFSPRPTLLRVSFTDQESRSGNPHLHFRGFLRWDEGCRTWNPWCWQQRREGLKTEKWAQKLWADPAFPLNLSEELSTLTTHSHINCTTIYYSSPIRE